MRTIAQETASQIALRNSSEEARKEPGCSVGVFARGKQMKHVVKHRKITANNKSRCLQLVVLVLSCVWGGARAWAR